MGVEGITASATGSCVATAITAMATPVAASIALLVVVVLLAAAVVVVPVVVDGIVCVWD